MADVLVDTSVWVAHFRKHNATLERLLLRDEVVIHPLIVGEIACGTPPRRTQTLSDLQTLRKTAQASLTETLSLIETRNLYGRGCGLTDLTLLASALLSHNVSIWTADKQFRHLTQTCKVAYLPE